jgi:hypothetical protein
MDLSLPSQVSLCYDLHGTTIKTVLTAKAELIPTTILIDEDKRFQQRGGILLSGTPT